MSQKLNALEKQGVKGGESLTPRALTWRRSSMSRCAALLSIAFLTSPGFGCGGTKKVGETCRSAELDCAAFTFCDFTGRCAPQRCTTSDDCAGLAGWSCGAPIGPDKVRRCEPPACNVQTQAPCPPADACYRGKDRKSVV